jgi:hypothetical protein
MFEWEKTNPAWRSDEDAFAHWLLQHDKNYFQDHCPLIGYLQFLTEGTATQIAVTGWHGVISWSVGGLHMVPERTRPPGYDERRWHFPD